MSDGAQADFPSLNATVEAKDPYTAGHSLRVQRIAVSIAQELGLQAKNLDAVRFGGLFTTSARSRSRTCS